MDSTNNSFVMKMTLTNYNTNKHHAFATIVHAMIAQQDDQLMNMNCQNTWITFLFASISISLFK